MNDNVRTRLELLNDGLNTPKRQYKKRKPSKKVESEQKPEVVDDVEAIPVEEQNIVFKPNEGPQTEFLASPEREVLYGGSAGGGKSYAMLADPLRYMNHPQFSGLLLRHTTEELRELVWKSRELYPQIYKGIKWSERKMQWVAPSGARLWMSYLDRDDDVLRYQGLAFSWIGFDELTQWATPFAWNYMRSRLRSTAPDLQVYMRATTNPGGPGHQWVKKMFIDPAPYGRAFDATNIETGKFLNILMDTVKQVKPCSKEDSSLLDYLIIHISHLKETTKRCFFPSLNTNVSSCLKVIGILKRVLLLLSLIGIFMLLNLLTFQEIGLSFVHVIMVMVLIVLCCGLLLVQMSNLFYIENCMFLKSLPQIWQRWY